MKRILFITVFATLLCSLSGQAQTLRAQATTRVTLRIEKYTQVSLPCPNICIWVTKDDIKKNYPVIHMVCTPIEVRTNHNLTLAFPDKITLYYWSDWCHWYSVRADVTCYSINNTPLQKTATGPYPFTYTVGPPGLPNNSRLTVYISRDWQKQDPEGVYKGALEVKVVGE